MVLFRHPIERQQFADHVQAFRQAHQLHIRLLLDISHISLSPLQMLYKSQNRGYRPTVAVGSKISFSLRLILDISCLFSTAVQKKKHRNNFLLLIPHKPMLKDSQEASR